MSSTIAKLFAAVTLLAAFSASATTRYVALTSTNPVSPFITWDTAATNIQDAIDVAVSNDTVLVSNGVYATGGRVVGGLLTNRVVITNAITVQSVNGPEVTHIKGAKDPNTLSTGDEAVRCVYITNAATLSGFTLTNGATRSVGDIDYDRDEDGFGGGLLCASENIVSNCIFIGNSAYLEGGGAHGGVLFNSRFIGNTAGYGGGAARVLLNNCTLFENSASQGGGVLVGTLNNCVLSGNRSAFNGGGVVGCTLNNCILTGNRATNRGGGVFAGTLNNCTVTDNSAGIGGGGVFSGGSFVTLYNCIVYSNTAPTDPNYIATYSIGFVTFHSCCTTPLPTNGTGNISNNPQFVNAATSNYHLLASSPCRDAGSNAYVVGTTDLDGNPRIVNGRVDMGAYEYDQTAATYDSDADGFSDQQEYFADTQATNAASFFPSVVVTNAVDGAVALEISVTSTGRVYGIFATTNLADAPQLWTLLPPEVSGTGAALVFTATNDVPFRGYRTGVRLP